MDANAKIILEKNVYRWITKCESVIKTWADCSSFELHHCRLDWATTRTAHKGGWYSSGPGINLAMWLLSRDRGNIFRMYEYASFDADPVIGGFYANDSNLATGMIVCHEMAHAVQFYRKIALKATIDRPHGSSFRKPYSLLRKAVLNPLLPEQTTVKAKYEQHIKDLLKL